MAKNFSQMTAVERRINRDRLARGLAADLSITKENAMLIQNRVRMAFDDATREIESNLLELEKARRVVERGLTNISPSALDDCKSAERVYLMALESLDVDTKELKKLDAVSLGVIFGLAVQTLNGNLQNRVAQDAILKPGTNRQRDASFAQRFPNVARVKRA